MVIGRLLAAVASIGLGSLAVAQNATADDRIKVRYGFELGVASTDGNPSWTQASVGKLREYNSDLPLRGFVDLRVPLAETVELAVAAELGSDPTARETGLTELYLSWRPVPRSGLRHRFRVGAFFPRISLENTGAGWTNRFTPTSSAINTWIGEELRTIGAEWTVSKRLSSVGQFSLTSSVFVKNDPTGSLLAWRGWSLHDRQSTLHDRVPLAPLPLNRSGAPFVDQAPYVAPFREVDGRTGLSVSGQWRSLSGHLVRAGFYDNFADPDALRDGQYAWHTRFFHFGLSIPVNERWLVVAQWLDGNTEMGPTVNSKQAVDNDFASYFVATSYRRGASSWFIRYDAFRVVDRDFLPTDNNNEDGFATTLGYRHRLNDRWSISGEWLRVETERPIWAFNGFATQRAESIWQLRAHWRR